MGGKDERSLLITYSQVQFHYLRNKNVFDLIYGLLLVCAFETHVAALRQADERRAQAHQVYDDLARRKGARASLSIMQCQAGSAGAP
ncbi:hypothetical protein EVAR_87916_1 [Eumeta japonica]|uniref:Uncharacterized protein n=1 Tax=Eumeta variegata TaxID=151549 RepID=A0A4C1WW29_EUMVA|nr:hypothetical protein EVAR_87916_1 [Eumeta japonica]